MNVLLVDDSKTMRNIQKAALATLGAVTTSEAADGVEGMKAIAAAPAPFDLILVDWNMPNMNGLEMVQAVRKTDRRTPIIMVTTEGEKERVIEAIKAGASNYVLKPFKTEDFVAKIQVTLAKAKAAA
jgi:two-component system chemotaxis response regulator CheY